MEKMEKEMEQLRQDLKEQVASIMTLLQEQQALKQAAAQVGFGWLGLA